MSDHVRYTMNETAYKEFNENVRDFWAPNNVPQVHAKDLSPENFYRTYVTNNSPVLIKGAFDHWPACTKWSPEYLMHTVGTKIISVNATPHGWADAISTIPIPLNVCQNPGKISPWQSNQYKAQNRISCASIVSVSTENIDVCTHGSDKFCTDVSTPHNLFLKPEKRSMTFQAFFRLLEPSRSAGIDSCHIKHSISSTKQNNNPIKLDDNNTTERIATQPNTTTGTPNCNESSKTDDQKTFQDTRHECSNCCRVTSADATKNSNTCTNGASNTHDTAHELEKSKSLHNSIESGENCTNLNETCVRSATIPVCGPAPGVVYLSEQNDVLRRDFPELLKDIDASNIYGTYAFQNEPEAINLWIGNEHSTSSLHKDFYENLYCVVTGEKIFTLIPPCEIIKLKRLACKQGTVFQCNKCHTWYTEIEKDVIHWCADFNSQEMNQEICSTRVVVGPGDMLYLPAMWYHQVHHRTFSIAVNYWHDMRFGPLYAYNSLFEQMQT